MIENENGILSDFVFDYITSQLIIAEASRAPDTQNFVGQFVESVSNLNMPLLMTSVGLMETSKMVFGSQQNQDLVLNMYEYYKLTFRHDEESLSNPGLDHSKVTARLRNAVCFSPDGEQKDRTAFRFGADSDPVPLLPDIVFNEVNEFESTQKNKIFSVNARWLVPIVLIKMFSTRLIVEIVNLSSNTPSKGK